MVLTAASRLSVFRSFIFTLATSRTCTMAMVAATARPGSLEPSVILAAFLSR